MTPQVGLAVQEKGTLEKTLHLVMRTTNRKYGILLRVYSRKNSILLRTLHAYPLLVCDIDYVHDKDRTNCFLLQTLYEKRILQQILHPVTYTTDRKCCILLRTLYQKRILQETLRAVMGWLQLVGSIKS